MTREVEEEEEDVLEEKGWQSKQREGCVFCEFSSRRNEQRER